MKPLVESLAVQFPDLKITKLYEEVPAEITKRQSWVNFNMNFSYSKMFSSTFWNFKHVEAEHNMALEYQVIMEFNRTRGKEFLPYSQFAQIYKGQKPQQLIVPKEKVLEFLSKMKLIESGRLNVILVSGIPGSDKHKLSESLVRML